MKEWREKAVVVEVGEGDEMEQNLLMRTTDDAKVRLPRFDRGRISFLSASYSNPVSPHLEVLHAEHASFVVDQLSSHWHITRS